MPFPPSRLTWAETRRKSAHVAAFWPALFLPWMSPLQALGAVFLLLLMNLFVLPWAARDLYRAGETGMGALEIILYPAALLASVIAFGYSPEAAAGETGKPAWYLPVGAAWFALAFVDACIGLASRLLPGGPVLPWNPRKPVVAVCLGALAAMLPAFALARLVLPSLPMGGWLALGFLVLVAACAETAWFGVADNLVIPFFVCVLVPLIPNPLYPGGNLSTHAWQWPPAPWYWMLAPIAFGAAAHAAKLLTRGGAVMGAVLSLFLVLANPWLLMFLGGFFVMGNLATRFGSSRKRDLGISEARGGERGATEVFGAMGMAAWMTPLVHLTAFRAAGDGTVAGALQGESAGAALLVCIAPLVAKTMDTVSSEMGKAMGGRTVSLRTWRVVAPGTEGAVSLEGTLWGLAVAGAMAAGMLPLGWGGMADAAALLAIALLANVFESFWGEYAARRGMDQGSHTNILMTLTAAVLAWLYWFGRC